MLVLLPGFVPVLIPLLGGADVLNRLRLAGPDPPEVHTPQAECQAMVAARRLIPAAEVVPVVLPVAPRADVPRSPLLQREVIAARALKKVHRSAPRLYPETVRGSSRHWEPAAINPRPELRPAIGRIGQAS